MRAAAVVRGRERDDVVAVRVRPAARAEADGEVRALNHRAPRSDFMRIGEEGGRGLTRPELRFSTGPARAQRTLAKSATKRTARDVRNMVGIVGYKEGLESKTVGIV